MIEEWRQSQARNKPSKDMTLEDAKPFSRALSAGGINSLYEQPDHLQQEAGYEAQELDHETIREAPPELNGESKIADASGIDAGDISTVLSLVKELGPDAGKAIPGLNVVGAIDDISEGDAGGAVNNLLSLVLDRAFLPAGVASIVGKGLEAYAEPHVKKSDEYQEVQNRLYAWKQGDCSKVFRSEKPDKPFKQQECFTDFSWWMD